MMLCQISPPKALNSQGILQRPVTDIMSTRVAFLVNRKLDADAGDLSTDLSSSLRMGCAGAQSERRYTGQAPKHAFDKNTLTKTDLSR